MKKNNKKTTCMALVVALLFGLVSCENPLELEFADVLIINQPPAVTPISSKILKEVSKPKQFDLAPNVRDQENDALSYVVVSRDPSVVEAAMNGSVLVLQSVAVGSTVLDVTIADSEGNEVKVTVDVAVEPGEDLEFLLDLNFDIADGPLAGSVASLTGVEGIWAGDPSTTAIVNGEVVVGPAAAGPEPWAGFELFITSIDISAEPRLEFRYADIANADDITFFFAGGEEIFIPLSSLGQEIVLNNPGWNTFRIDDLQAVFDDLELDVDLTSVGAFGLSTETAGNTFKIDDLKIGVKQ